MLRTPAGVKASPAVFRMELRGANRGAQVTGADKLAGVANYLGQISLGLTGARPSLDPDGNVVLKLKGGNLALKKPGPAHWLSSAPAF